MPHDEFAPVQYVSGVAGPTVLWSGTGSGWCVSMIQSALPAVCACVLSNSAFLAATAGVTARHRTRTAARTLAVIRSPPFFAWKDRKWLPKVEPYEAINCGR